MKHVDHSTKSTMCSLITWIEITNCSRDGATEGNSLPHSSQRLFL